MQSILKNKDEFVLDLFHMFEKFNTKRVDVVLGEITVPDYWEFVSNEIMAIFEVTELTQANKDWIMKIHSQKGFELIVKIHLFQKANPTDSISKENNDLILDLALFNAGFFVNWI